jgi:hypothetical protein
VDAIGNARRQVTHYQHRPAHLEQWLAGELRIGGIRANAAALAVIESTHGHPDFLRAYLQRFPDHQEVVNELAQHVSSDPRDAERAAAVLDAAVAAVQR